LSTEEAGDMLDTAEDMFKTLQERAPERYVFSSDS
jgi:hypothetical protein